MRCYYFGMKIYMNPKTAAKVLGCHVDSLRRLANAGKIGYIKTPGGQRRYDVQGYIDSQTESLTPSSVTSPRADLSPIGSGQADITTVCYCRVSGKGQTDDSRSEDRLESQVAYMRSKFPTAEIIRDSGSDINFKREGSVPRQGLHPLLERIIRGDKLRIIVAHRDRIAQFGGEVIQFWVEQNGGEVVVLDSTVHSPEAELAADSVP